MQGSRAAVARLKAYWRFKLVAVPAFMGLFFVGYFHVLESPRFAVTEMPLTALDRAIEFHPGALPAYISLWLYASLSFGLLRDWRGFLSYGGAATGLALVGLAIFFRWPTAVPPPEIDWSKYGAFAALKTIDASGNACPSLHVAFAVFAALWIGRILREIGASPALRLLNGAWCAAIVYSTLATKQHVAIDATAGAVLGAAAAWMGLRRYAAGPADAGLQATNMP
jgi:membrane-associated phospholipid phosphatase